MSTSDQTKLPASERDDELVPLGVKVTPDMKDWLDARSRDEDRSMSAIVRIALTEYRRRVEAAA